LRGGPGAGQGRGTLRLPTPKAALLSVAAAKRSTRGRRPTSPAKNTPRLHRHILAPNLAIAGVQLSSAARVLLRPEWPQPSQRLALGLGAIKADILVFSTVEGGLLSPDNLSRDWRRISASRKLPGVAFHALRHTHASVLISKGVDILTISRRLGHSKPSVTLDVYGHLIKGTDMAAAEAIAAVLRTPGER
jgi:site-specific recombinase XerD